MPSTRTVVRALRQRAVAFGVSRFDAVSVAGLLALGSYLFYPGLGSYPLLTWDEAIYADVARRMVETGNWAVPRTQFELGVADAGLAPFLEKPPLVYWLQAASMRAFGVGEFAARFPSATFAVVSAVVVYALGRSMAGYRTGLAAGAVFLANPFLSHVNNAGRFGGMDTTLTAFGAAFVVCVWLAVDRRDSRYLVPGGVAAGLAFLAKGFNAGVFALAVLPLLVRYWRRFQPRDVAAGVAAGAVVVLPWPVFAWTQFGRKFRREFLVEQVLGRVSGDLYVHPDGTFAFMKYPYFERLLFDATAYRPHLFFVVPAVGFAVAAVWLGRNRVARRDVAFLAWWAACVLGFFVVTGNHFWYLLPMFVATAVLVGRLVAAASRLDPVAVACVLAGLLGPSLLAASQSPPTALAGVAVATAAAVVAAVGASDRVSVPTPRPAPSLRTHTVAVIAAVALAAAVAGGPAVHDLPYMDNQRDLAHEAAADVPEGETVYVQPGLPKAMHTFAFYAERPLDGEPVAGINRRSGSGVRYAVVEASAVSRLHGDARVLARADQAFADVVLVEITPSPAPPAYTSNS